MQPAVGIASRRLDRADDSQFVQAARRLGGKIGPLLMACCLATLCEPATLVLGGEWQPAIGCARLPLTPITRP
jgi:hypothetical protein